MYFFQERLVAYIVEIFKSMQFNDPAEGDSFFGLFGPGNTTHLAERPFERFSDYQELLLRLMKADPDKYKKMHKGTAFGFLSWLAFDLRNYEKGLFYLDAGISEDVRKANPPETWINNPGPRLLFFDVDPSNDWFKRTVLEWKRILEAELTRFNGISGERALDLPGSWQKFLRNLTADATNRTIISATYVFLLEFEDRRQELGLREGSRGGSNQPFTVHLFSGGLLFESLLKHCYRRSDGTPFDTLGEILHCQQFLDNFFGGKDPFTKGDFSASSLKKIYDDAAKDNSMLTAFKTAAKLRNTTGHNLVWDDIFDTADKYVVLFQQLMNAILYVISRKLV